MTILSVTEIKENIEVDRLNNLIYQYNNLDIHKVRNEDKLIMLQRIDVLSRKIFTDYIASKPNDDSNQFYNWFKSEPLLSELNTLCKGNINLSNQRLFELYSPVINSGGFVPLYNAFQQVEIANKKGQIDLKSIKNQLDLLVIHERNLQKNPNDNTFINNYYKHLHLLQDKIISARNSIDPQPKEVKELCKQLDQMLQAVNSEAALFVTKNNLQNEKYLKRFKYPIKEITNWLCQGNQEALIKLLNETSDSKGKIEFQTLDGFDFKGLGGENNKNWRVTDSISGATFTVRLEKFDKMPYKGMEREVLYYKGNKHLEDNFETITLGKHKPENSNVKKSNEYVLAIGEFCSLGDILNAVRNMNGNDPEKKINTALNMVYQICEFNIELIRKGFIYSDLKPENFLLRNDGTVITADLKSVMRLNEDGSFQAKKNRNDPAPPMTVKPSLDLQLKLAGGETIDPELFSSHLIAAAMNILIRNDKHLNGSRECCDVNGTFKPDFTDSIYSTVKGLKVKELIEKIIVSNDKDNKVSLDEIMSEIKSIQNYASQTNDFRERLKMIKLDKPIYSIDKKDEADETEENYESNSYSHN